MLFTVLEYSCIFVSENKLLKLILISRIITNNKNKNAKFVFIRDSLKSEKKNCF